MTKLTDFLRNAGELCLGIGGEHSSGIVGTIERNIHTIY